ncbi:type I-E CRISPR-associated protein Cas5/CasD [bacterium]|jgi:CRISPR system Cascade subunit CasD|nr:type I-E CRISPR-associated protein Cas5/CasD [bacterium]
MGTLLLRIVAPLQSWGIQSNFTVRDSGLEPSKSGIIGLVCAALGRPRQADLSDLSGLRMGVRVDREGILKKDYHIAQSVLKSDGKNIQNMTTNRYYLADAAFLVGLEGDSPVLQSIQAALQHPVWPLFFGRKAFTPAAPVFLRDGLLPIESLESAFEHFGWIVRWKNGQAPRQLRWVLEAADGEQARADVPISFAERRFSSRRVKTIFKAAPVDVSMEVQG